MGFFRKKAAPPAEPEALHAWMEAEYGRGSYSQIWEHRLRLGVGFAQGQMTDRTWFWLNAYPALSALRTEGRGHPLISTCAGWSDQVHRGLGPEEKLANDEIAKLFFG